MGVLRKRSSKLEVREDGTIILVSQKCNRTIVLLGRNGRGAFIVGCIADQSGIGQLEAALRGAEAHCTPVEKQSKT